VRGDRAAGRLEAGGLDLQPQHHGRVDAEGRLVDVDVEIQQPGLPQFLDPAAHGRLVPARRGGEVGDRCPAVAGQFGDQRVVLIAQDVRPGRDPGRRGAQRRGRLWRRRKRRWHGFAEGGEPAGRQATGIACVHGRGELMQDRIRGDGGDVAAAGQAAQE